MKLFDVIIVGKINIEGLKDFEGKGVSYCTTCEIAVNVEQKLIGVIESLKTE